METILWASHITAGRRYFVSLGQEGRSCDSSRVAAGRGTQWDRSWIVDGPGSTAVDNVAICESRRLSFCRHLTASSKITAMAPGGS
jgi:hypothetical protein